MAATAEATAVVTVTAVTVAEAAAVVTKVAVARAAVALQSAITGIANALIMDQIFLGIAPTADGMLLTNTAPTVAILQQADVTVVPAVAVPQNAITETINATETHHTDAQAVAGLTMNTAQTAAAIRLANATAVRAAAVLAVNTLHVHQN